MIVIGCHSVSSITTSNLSRCCHAGKFEVVIGWLSVADLASIRLSSDANCLILVSQVSIISLIEGSECTGSGAKEILKASLRGLVCVIARKLGNFNGPWTCDSSSCTQLEDQITAGGAVIDVDIHVVTSIGSANNWGCSISGWSDWKLIILASSHISDIFGSTKGFSTSSTSNSCGDSRWTSNHWNWKKVENLDFHGKSFKYTESHEI